MSTRLSLLSILSDGQFHSGPALGDQLGVSRAAINKAVQSLTERGLEIHSVSGKGYRWPSPGTLLDSNRILEKLPSSIARAIPEILVLEETESTSSYLLNRVRRDQFVPEACFTEHQSGGRGRRGRQWYATPFQNIMMSISWRYDAGPSRLSGLSIAAGIAIVRALNQLGIESIELKWPNDVLYNGRKLAGTLVDIRGEVDGPTIIVIGVGLNIRLEETSAADIDQAWIDLANITNQSIERNELAANLIRELYNVLGEFDSKGLSSYLAEWKDLHAFENQPVKIIQGDSEITGTVCGLDENGALLLDTGDEVVKVHSGEVSLRAS